MGKKERNKVYRQWLEKFKANFPMDFYMANNGMPLSYFDQPELEVPIPENYDLSIFKKENEEGHTIRVMCLLWAIKQTS